MSCRPPISAWVSSTLVASALASALTAHAQTPTPPNAATTPSSNAAGGERAYSLDRKDIRAQLLPRRFTTIAAEIGAKVEQIPVTDGGRFSQGQTLARFDCSLQQALASKAKADLEAAQTTLTANERMAQLNTIGQLELDLSRTAVTKAQAEVGAQQSVLSKCEVKAPFSGRVAEQKAREQQYVQPGQALLEIIEDSVLELEFLLPSHWLTWLKTGYRFQIAIDETGKTYTARVSRMGARVDPVSQSIKVTATIEGRNPELMVGMGGRVLITPPSNSTR